MIHSLGPMRIPAAHIYCMDAAMISSAPAKRAFKQQLHVGAIDKPWENRLTRRPFWLLLTEDFCIGLREWKATTRLSRSSLNFPSYWTLLSLSLILPR